MTKTLVSLILPIYNVESYISDCISSIISQSYRNLELILIDDGTPDKSIEVAEELLKNQELPYKIIRQPNRGVSAARNRGMNAANGDWIVMVDPDDTIHKDFVISLIKSIDPGNMYNIAITDYQVVRKHETFKHPQWNNGKELISRSEAQKRFLYKSSLYILPSMLISRRLIKEYSLKFDEQCRFSEDTQFVWMVLCYIESVVFIKRPLYNYCYHENSTMTSSGIEKIYTGYIGLQNLHLNHINGCAIDLVKEQLKPRWIFSTMHCAAKILNYSDFMKLLRKIEFDNHSAKMKRCRDYRITITLWIFYFYSRLGFTILKKL